jgi:hypothetical protein
MPQPTPYKTLKDYTLTTPGGCKIVVNGELGVLAGTFTGTAAISRKGCPITGTFEFKSAKVPGKPGGAGLTVSFDNADLAKVARTTWSGGAEIAALLNEESVNAKLSGFFRAKAKK